MPGHPDCLVDGEVDAGGEPPRPVVNDPDGETDRLAVAAALQTAVAERQGCVAGPFDADVGVGRPTVAGGLQGGVRERRVGQGQELGIDVVGPRVGRVRAAVPGAADVGAPRRGGGRCGHDLILASEEMICLDGRVGRC